MKAKVDSLTVCICTYKRPDMLGHLLDKLREQKCDGLFGFDIVIVDNDREETARAIVSGMRERTEIPILYSVEPEKNISMARNRALRMAKGRFIACIDDDEFPENDWLLNLWRTAVAQNADGVLGPVIPSFATPAPWWLVQGKLLDRQSFPTGTRLTDSSQTRTGNFLISKQAVQDDDTLFDRRYGFLGGEDIDFFRRMLAKGYIFVWCDEARVNETIPSSRLKRAYFLKRGLLTGTVRGRHGSLLSYDSLKSFTAVSVYSFSLPLLLVFRPRSVMPCLIKSCHHMAKILTRCGLNLIKERPI